ncbi:uncharacterized protein LOC120695849 [Panicum virgatum]|uniref:uncharacterized protein LOC120695849 n=1 Tax=Panicum virgatum TaxID=38727 RepID=UPI0019D684E6|nr:uncharacterized protein LOC120695849 [Panicum virgatum]
MLRRATSQRKSPAVEDYNVASGGRRGMTQQIIDTGSWTQKGRNAKEVIGKAWSKSFFGNNVSTRAEYLKVLEDRMRDVFIGTYVGPAAVLNPRYSYTMDPTQEMFRGLKDTFERMTDVQSAVQALQELEVFRQKVDEFGSEMAMRMAMDPKTSPCKS